MLKMLTSTSRLVLLVMAAAVVAGFLLGKLEPKEFMMLAGMVFAYYFTKVQSGRNDEYES